MYIVPHVWILCRCYGITRPLRLSRTQVQQSALVGVLEEGERTRMVEALYKSPRRSPRGVHSPFQWKSELTEEEEVASCVVGSTAANEEGGISVARSLGSEFGEC